MSIDLNNPSTDPQDIIDRFKIYMGSHPFNMITLASWLVRYDSAQDELLRHFRMNGSTKEYDEGYEKYRKAAQQLINVMVLSGLIYADILFSYGVWKFK